MQLATNAAVIVDALCNRVNQLDNCLCAAVTGGCLCTKDECAAGRIKAGVFNNAVIEVHDVQHVQELSLVLMQTLYLNVKNAF